jgi:hypothetical protein
MNITYTTVRDLVWRNPEHTVFDCYVFFEHINEEVPFGCFQSEVSVYPHVASIWERAMAGEFGEIAEWAEEVPPIEEPTGIPVATPGSTEGS